MTAAGIATVLNLPSISVNSVYCEWMSPKLFDETQLRGLILFNNRERIEREYLNGVTLTDLDKGFEEAVLYYPEDSDRVKERSQRVIRSVV